MNDERVYYKRLQRTCRSDTNPVAPSHICDVSNMSSSGGTIDRALAHLSDCEHCSWFNALDSKGNFGMTIIRVQPGPRLR